MRVWRDKYRFFFCFLTVLVIATLSSSLTAKACDYQSSGDYVCGKGQKSKKTSPIISKKSPIPSLPIGGGNPLPGLPSIPEPDTSIFADPNFSMDEVQGKLDDLMDVVSKLPPELQGTAVTGHLENMSLEDFITSDGPLVSYDWESKSLYFLDEYLGQAEPIEALKLGIPFDESQFPLTGFNNYIGFGPYFPY